MDTWPDDTTIRVKILAELRSQQIRNSGNPNSIPAETSIESMAISAGYEIGTINRVCSELEEEGYIRWLEQRTIDLIQKSRTFDITAQGRTFLENLLKNIEKVN